ncbi:hypothetical protein [Alteromonas sp. H39]|uniref:hypothetical protein n=1 Tax=Alteromonas sp. H39 TaxID=3389876 RepID=UPI0039E1288E
MAEPNSTITNVLAVAIALTAIGTGGEARSDKQAGERAEWSGDTSMLSEQHWSASLSASLMPEPDITERQYSQLSSLSYKEVSAPLHNTLRQAVPETEDEYGFISVESE